jgi:flagellar protein FlgJ
MRSKIRKFIVGPMMVLAVSGGVLVVDVQAANAAVSSVRVRGKLNVRAGAANWTPLTRTFKNRTKVTVTCRMTGQYIRGTVRRSAQWDRLMMGDYIPHAYLAGNPRLPVCPPPPPPPAPVVVAPPVAVPVPVPVGPTSTVSTAEFIAGSVPGAQQSQRDSRVPASVTVAQAILESGWGRSALSTFDKNFFGMKCFTQGRFANGCRSHTTAECTPAGVCFTTDAVFRTYASAADSYRDHGALLAENPRYANAFNYINNPNQFAAEIHLAGYATDPLYTTKLTAIMAKFNLSQYDLV